MRRMLVAVAMVFLLAPGLRAQDDAAKRAKVEELFTVMRLDHMMDRLMGAVRQQTETMMRSMPGMEQMTPEQKRITDDFEKKIMDAAMESVGWKAMEPDMVNLYVSTYSTQEIDGLIAFYKSPVGQAYLDKTPELTQKSMQITQQKVVTLQPKLRELVEEYRKQIEAAAPKSGGTTTAPEKTAPTSPH